MHRGDFPSLRPKSPKSQGFFSRKYGVDCKTVSKPCFFGIFEMHKIFFSHSIFFHCHTLSKLENWQKMFIYFFFCLGYFLYVALLETIPEVMEKSIFVNDLGRNVLETFVASGGDFSRIICKTIIKKGSFTNGCIAI